MATLTWHPNLLSDEQLDDIHHSAVELASRVGLSVPHDGLLGRLAGQSEVRINGQRVYFHETYIERAVESIDFPPKPASDQYAIISGAYIIGVHDLDSGRVRRATHKDLVELLMLGEQLGMRGSPPVRPLDLPEPLQEIAMYKATWEYSRDRPEALFDTTPMSTRTSAEVIYRMSQAIDKSFSVGMYLISPFTCPLDGLDVVEAFLERRVPMWIGSMPIAGLNSPVFLLGAHVQALAELMAGTALLRMLSEGQVPIYWTPIDSVRAHPFDMQHAAFVFGSAEDQLGTLLQTQINEYYDIPIVAKSLLTTAHDPDEQAAVEKASHTVLAALAGARVFTNAGFLAVDNYVSPVQMVIDHEIVEYVRHVVEGMRTDEEAMALSVIRDVVQDGGDFLSHSSTYENFRQAAWYPDLFRHVNYSSEVDADCRSLFDRARRRAKDLIARGDYVLPAHDRAVLEKIYREAERSVGAAI